MSQDLDLPPISVPPGILLVEPTQKEEFIERPEDNRTRSQEGLVLGVGNQIRKENTTSINLNPLFVPGDTVIYKQWVGTEYKYNGRNLLFLSFDDIKGVIQTINA